MTDPTPFHLHHPAISAQQVRAECARELAQRRRFYDRRINEGRMTAEEAAHERTCAEAWLADVDRIIAFEAASAAAWERFKANPAEPHVLHLPPPSHPVSWRDRRAALARELSLRARVYPRRIEEGAMTRAAADHQRACLAALADRYDDGFDWTASNGERPQWASTAPTEETRAARREWDQHRQAVEARRQPATQGEMAI